MSTKTRKALRKRRHFRIRENVKGTASRPRMAVFISGKHMYVQLIDDVSGHTLASSSTLSAEFKETGKKTNVEGAVALGKIAAEKAKAVSITEVVFDRGGFKYHGRIKAIAEAAREAGIKV